MCVGGKMCVCGVNPVSGFVCEWHTSGMVMHMCVCVETFACVCAWWGVCTCVCDRGPRRLQLMMSVSSQLGKPVIVTLLKQGRWEQKHITLITSSPANLQKEGRSRKMCNKMKKKMSKKKKQKLMKICIKCYNLQTEKNASSLIWAATISTV